MTRPKKTRRSAYSNLHTAEARVAVGLWLARARVKAELTQAIIADMLSVSQVTIARIEKGESEPSILLFIDWIRILDYEPDSGFHLVNEFLQSEVKK